MNSKDPKGYYAQLRIQFDASETEIKVAFRKKALELHPDRNPSAKATEEFQYLNEAYSVLSNPLAKAAYDKHGADYFAFTKIIKRQTQPITCSSCGKITMYPRYIIYAEIRSLIFLTRQNLIEGIFCYPCSEKKVLQATLTTWLLGWWGIPWGPIFSVRAIIQNLLGGKEPFYRNANALKQQADFVLDLGNPDLAGIIAADALKYSKKGILKMASMGSSYQQQVNDLFKLQQEIEDLLKSVSLDSDEPITPPKTSWRPKNSFLIQIGFIIIACVALMLWLSTPRYPTKPLSSQLEPPSTQNPLR